MAKETATLKNPRASSIEQYLQSIIPERVEAVTRLRNIFLENLPQGFEEQLSYGMLGYVVPHSIYPKGYHCNPSLPLPFINLASQKGHLSIHHMGLYSNPTLLSWFLEEYPKHSTKKVDIGKGCLRFKKMEDIPFDLIQELATKITPQQWIECIEKVLSDGKENKKAKE